MVLLKRGEFRVIIINKKAEIYQVRGVNSEVIKEEVSYIGTVKIFKHRKLIAEGIFNTIHDIKSFTEFLE